MLRTVALWVTMFLGIMATVEEAIPEALDKKSRLKKMQEYQQDARNWRGSRFKGNPQLKREPSEPGGRPVLHQIEVSDIKGNAMKLDNHNFPDAKIFLIVNIASASERVSQLKGLQKLQNQFQEEGLQIIAFPSNTFNTEPLEPREILTHYQTNYGITFPVMDICEVNLDADADFGLYTFLKIAAASLEESRQWGSHDLGRLHELDLQSDFEKFFVYRSKGREFVKRFSYEVDPEDLVEHIEQMFMKVEDIKVEL